MKFKDLPHSFKPIFELLELIANKETPGQQLQLEALEAVKYFARWAPMMMESFEMQRREMDKANQRILTLIDDFNERGFEHLNEISELQNSKAGQPTKNTKVEMLEDDRQRLLNYIACLAYSAQHKWDDLPDQAWRFLPDRLQHMVNEMIIEVGNRYHKDNNTLQ